MIVDAHIHIRSPLDPARLEGPEGARSKAVLDMLGLGPTAEEEMGQRVRLMDEAGIDLAMIINTAPHPSIGFGGDNDTYVRLMNAYPGRFGAVAAVQLHPTPNLAGFEHAVADLGCRGVKIVPSIAYCYPDDFELLDPLYKKAIEMDVPVMWHIGDIGLGVSRPIYGSMDRLAEVVHRYPELQHLIAHLGGHCAAGIEETVIEFAANRPNVFIEASYAPRAAMMRELPLGGPPPYERYLTDFLYSRETWSEPVQAAWERVKPGQIRLIRQAANTCPDRFLFTSDTPLAISMALAVDLYREALDGSEVFDLVMAENARRLFKLDRVP